MMKVTTVMGCENLPAWAEEKPIREENWVSYLLIEDGDYRAVYSDAMEPEDATFGRDLKWVKEEIERAYASGIEVGRG